MKEKLITNSICFEPIGIIHSSFKSAAGMPIQPFGAKKEKGYIELNPMFVAGLKDLDGFSHITLIYHFHLSTEYKLEVKPFMDKDTHGVFATRVPKRPNSIGLSTVKVGEIKGNIIQIEEVDIIDGTPLLDIKPYFRQFDNRPNAFSGWLDKQKDIENIRSDNRFEEKRTK